MLTVESEQVVTKKDASSNERRIGDLMTTGDKLTFTCDAQSEIQNGVELILIGKSGSATFEMADEFI